MLYGDVNFVVSDSCGLSWRGFLARIVVGQYWLLWQDIVVGIRLYQDDNRCVFHCVGVVRYAYCWMMLLHGPDGLGYSDWWWVSWLFCVPIGFSWGPFGLIPDYWKFLHYSLNRSPTFV